MKGIKLDMNTRKRDHHAYIENMRFSGLALALMLASITATSTQADIIEMRC